MRSGGKVSKSNKTLTQDMTQANRYVFTVNTHAAAFAARLSILYHNEEPAIRYICGQLEIAPETGNLHFQGYVQLTRSQRLSWVKTHIHPTAHFEAQRARDNNLARDYCRKEETRAPGQDFIEYGEFTERKGSRTDLARIRDAIKEGSSHMQLVEEYPNEYGRYPKFADRCFALYKPMPHPNGVRVILYFGEPGTGKTRKAYEEHQELYCTPISNGALWLDGYDREPTVMLDDFSGALSKWSLTETLRLLDRYPVLVPIKGSFTWWIPETIIVTTNIHPFRWYKWKGRENQYYALHRRFHEVWYFPLTGEAEEQDLETFFYDEEVIWPGEATLHHALPVPPVWFHDGNSEQHMRT